MTMAEHVWMTRQAYIRLQMERAQLRARPGIARGNRIRRIEELLARAVVGAAPPDDGIAEPGMAVTVRHDDTGRVDTVLLGVRGIEAPEIDVCSPESPLGRALDGARSGERRTYATPDGNTVTVTVLDAVPYATRDTRRLATA